MTSRDRLLAVLGVTDRSVDRVPWVPLIDLANTPCFVPREIRSLRDSLATGLFLNGELGCDVLLGTSVVKRRYRTAEVSVDTSGDMRVTRWRIVGRSIEAVDKVVFHGLQESSARMKYPLSTEDDVRTFALLLDDAYIEPDTSEYRRMDRGVGDAGIVTPMVPRTPVMELIIELMGLERFTFACIDWPELMAEILSAMDGLVERCCRMTVEAAVDFSVARNHDDFDVLLTTPTTFAESIAPRLKRYSDIFHAAEKKFMVHACGHMREFLPFIRDAGYDAHHYLTSRPVGNVDFGDEAVSALASEVVMMPAVDPLLMEDGTAAAVAAEIGRIRSAFEDAPAWILMTANKPRIPEANIRVVPSALSY